MSSLSVPGAAVKARLETPRYYNPMQLPRYLFAEEPEFECVIRTVAPRFIGRIDPDMQGRGYPRAG